MKDLVLIVDFGTSSVRAIAMNAADGETVASASVKYTIEAANEGWCEISADELWEDAQSCVARTVEKLGADGAAIRAISFSFFGTNVIPVDGDGNALNSCILCYDQRGGEEADEINRLVTPTRMKRICGDPCDCSYLCSKLFWIKRNRPELFAATDKFYTIQQFVLRKMGLPDVIDRTMASATGTYDIRTKGWPEEILAAISVSQDMLTPIVESDEVLGEIDHFGRVPLPCAVKVTPGAHDMDCGLVGLGSGNDRAPAAAEVTGTFDHVGLILNEDIVRDYDNAGKPVWASVGPLRGSTSLVSMFSTSGSLLDWFMREIAGGNTQEDYARLWEAVVFDGEPGVEIDPRFLSNEGAICNLSVTRKRADIFKAIIETLTFETRRCLELCEEHAPNGISRVVIGGGAANSPQWIQLKADVTGKTFLRPEIIESSALGAAVMACAAVGLYPDVRDAVQAMVRVQKSYEPNGEVFEKYDKKYRAYLNKYYAQPEKEDER